MPRWTSKALAVTPGLLVSTVLTTMIGAVLPALAGLVVFWVGLAVAALLGVGLGERFAARVLFRARRPSPGQLEVLAPAITLLCRQGLGPPVVTALVQPGVRAVAAGGVGRRSLVVSSGLLEALAQRQLPADQAAAVMAHAVGLVRGGFVRADALIAFWSLPWQLLRELVSGVSRAGARLPLTALAWRLRVIVAGIAVVQATVAGHLWVGAVIAAVTAVSYAAPVWESRWQAILVAAGDETVLLHGLGVAMSTFLRRCPSTVSIQARVFRLERGVARPALGVVPTPT